MLSALRFLLPVSVSVLVAIYNYYKSRQKFSEGVEVPLNPTSGPSPATSDLDHEILDWIRTLDPAVLNRIRNPDPALLHEIHQFNPAVEIRNFDPSIVDRIRNLDPAFPSDFSESVDVPQKPPSVPSPEPSVVEILDWIGTLGPAVLDEIQQFDPAFLDEDRSFDPSIVDGIPKLSLKKKEEKAEEEEKERETEREKENERERESEKSESSSGGGGGNENGGEVEEEVVEESSRRDQYPLRLGDCRYHLRTGNCKFGSNCKYNHPRRRKNKQVSKDKAKKREELEKEQDQTESKYYISPGQRIGVPSVAPALELNFSGLPIRPGEKDCPYYMRTGTCKYETNCKFNHPDPTAAGESRPQSTYGNGRPAPLQDLPKSQGINSETTEWNGYQAPAHLPHRSMPAPPPSVHRSMPAPAPPPYVMNNSVTETNYCGQYAQQTQAEEFPERPGQPVCFYFTQTGDCVNKSNCQYHHPKNQTAATPSCAPSDRGLPLRPGQNICTEYSRFGVCSSGPTCIFDHPSLSDSFL
ncbi:zinc finger CCCH domain-containing protein 43 isoform X45 [Pyrus x bretschneideri]|uniref:zinc finger CCCH domain-containing protein 43 isoform X45 n=1 Tax=Pyrus x bretschneideri TaxID=225117 RepID=UPI00202EF25E|nr:zinc finger CCCH domain-containing protein 43 isoform X45 [Pyrus x bretschneideri]